MTFAAFVLAGGRSSRMGRNKALLALGGRTAIERVVEAAAAAADSVTVVAADPEPYRFLGRPVIPDRRAAAGPLGGIEAALAATRTEWSFVVGCDLPFVTSALLTRLGKRIETGIDVVVPIDGEGVPQATVALWNRSALAAVSAALDRGERSVQAILRAARTRLVSPAEVADLPGAERFFLDLDEPSDLERARLLLGEG